MIYFVQVGRTGPIKIGFSEKPKRRLITLQVDHFEQLHLLYTFEGSEKNERDLHTRFATSKIRGEWFKPEAVLEFIKSCSLENRQKEVKRRHALFADCVCDIIDVLDNASCHICQYRQLAQRGIHLPGIRIQLIPNEVQK